MASFIFQRDNTWFVRVTFPENRWADIGKAMDARSGIKREIVRTLETTAKKEAEGRKDAAAAAIGRVVDAALTAAKLKPLDAWTGEWMSRAVQLRTQMREHGGDVVSEEAVDDPEHGGDTSYASDYIQETIEAEVEIVRRRQGRKAADQFELVAAGRGMTVADASRHWLGEERQKVRAGTVQSHEAALKRLGEFLADVEGMPSLEGVALSAVTRRMAGDLINDRRQTKSAETVGREFSAFSGLWRWAVRRGHAEINPWTDQTAGLKARRPHDEDTEKRGYSTAELVKLIRADGTQLAPGRGGYAATMWDIIRLSLLTGSRASELLSLRFCDVLEGGSAVVLVPDDGKKMVGKSSAAARVVPLHPLAQRVVADRMASLPNRAQEASLWPEVPETGRDSRRSKIISNRFVAVRRRILGDSDEVDLHSFRRSFVTAGESAIHGGGRLTIDLLHLLDGHQREGLSLGLYSDWSRMGRTGFRGALGERLKVLRDAVEDIVQIGFAGAVLDALNETAKDRPAVVRTTPAFRRHS